MRFSRTQLNIHLFGTIHNLLNEGVDWINKCQRYNTQIPINHFNVVFVFKTYATVIIMIATL